MQSSKEEIVSMQIANLKKTICWYPDEVYCGKRGQTVSLSPTGVYLESPDTGFCIFINSQRSMLKNYDLALTFFRMYLDEINKF